MKKTRTVKISFTGGSGYELDARLELPASLPKAYAIFCHCFTCTKDTITTFRISRAMAKRGYAVLRFDFTGLGNSKGDFAQTNFTSNVNDVIAAVDYLRNFYQAPALLMGHSLGGTAALEAATIVTEVKAVVTVASPSQPDHVLHHFGKALEQLEKGLPSGIEVAGQYYEIDPPFIDDLRHYDMKRRLATMKKPALIFSIKDDELVNEENAVELDQWISGDTTVITLSNSDHLLSSKQDSERVADEIVKWLEKAT